MGIPPFIKAYTALIYTDTIWYRNSYGYRRVDEVFVIQCLNFEPLQRAPENVLQWHINLDTRTHAIMHRKVWGEGRCGLSASLGCGKGTKEKQTT